MACLSAADTVGSIRKVVMNRPEKGGLTFAEQFVKCCELRLSCDIVLKNGCTEKQPSSSWDLGCFLYSFSVCSIDLP